MNEVSKLFDVRSKKYSQIYTNLNLKKLLHREKLQRLKLVERLILDLSKNTDDELIIDIGCGTGNLLCSLRDKLPAKMYGFDISKEMIKVASRQDSKDVIFKVGTIDDVSKKANIVCSLGVMGYQDDQEIFLQNLSTLIDTEGYLIFTTANGNSITRFMRNFLIKFHRTIFRKSNRVEFLSIKEKKVQKVLCSRGFKLIKKTYITFGLGLFSSSIECKIDRLLFKYINNKFIGKFLSLSVIYLFKRI
tara:strand:- start:16668 stop:17408 length:741 start_codon:yes stop_codon:yes gene_type:complete